MKIKIDPEFKALIPPPADGELKQLEENLLKDGCRDPLVIWTAEKILLDGHNRHEICTRNKIPFDVAEVELDTRDQAKLWMIKNQQGRRNLSDIDRIALSRAKESILRPMAEKLEKAGKGPDGSGGRGNKKNPRAKLPKGLATRREGGDPEADGGKATPSKNFESEVR